MRYLLDTSILIFKITDKDRLSRDVCAILEDPDNTFYLSVESVRELIVLFRKKRYLFYFWKSAKEMQSGNVLLLGQKIEFSDV